MSENDGAGVGSSAPEPTVKIPRLDIEVDSVSTFGQALHTQAEHVGTVGGKIRHELRDPDGGENDRRGVHAGAPFGVDPRQETLHQIGVWHSQKMDAMNAYTKNVHTGLKNLGVITEMITAEFPNQDRLNAAGVDRIKDIINEAKTGKGSLA